jgi:lipoate---protein ligase
MKLIQLPDTDAYFNLAAEEYIFNHLDPGEEYLLLWQNQNAIVVGVHQNTCEEINQKFVDANSIQVVRRLTGGGAVYHDLGNLNYSYIVDHTGSGFNFQTLAGPVMRTLEKMGGSVEFTGRNDLTMEGIKISGSAQMIKRGRILHHGTLLFNSDLDKISMALNVKGDKIESKGIKSVRNRVTNIQEHIPHATIDMFKAMLLDEIKLENHLSEYEFTAEDLVAILTLRQEKYCTWEWNYGKSPDYNIRKERRFDQGRISIYMTIQKGIIESIRIFGDFFGNGDISKIESCLQSVEIREDAINRAMENFDIQHYIQGLGQLEFVKMIVS